MKNIFQVLVVFAALQSFTLSQSSWQIIPSGTSVSLHSIHFSDYNNGYAVGDGGTILKSTNGGTTWQIQSIPGLTPLYDVFVFNQNNVVVVGSGGSIFKTTDGGLNWLSVQSGVTDELFSVSFSGSNGICGGGSQTILYSTDMGASWNIFQTGFFGGGFWGAYMLTPQIGFVAGENSIFQPLFAKTTDSGLNWDFTAFYLNNNEGKATGIDFTDLNTGYVSASVWDGTGAIAKTTDGGVNWISVLNTNPLWDIDFPISGASLIGYAVGENGTILKTFNSGLSWPPQQSGTQQRLNGVYFLDLDFGFAVGDNGIILRTTDGGVPVELTSFSAIVHNRDIILNWTTATETNNHGFEIEKLLNSDWGLIGFVEGNGTTTEPKAYSFKDANLETGVHKYRLKQIDLDGKFEYSEIVEAVITTPNEFELNQNYPNPFNPTTKIKFTIPNIIANETKQSQMVTLKVYDVLGNEVTTLVNKELPSGEYEVEFSVGRDSSPEIASGIYFYQLQAAQFLETKKMILIK